MTNLGPQLSSQSGNNNQQRPHKSARLFVEQRSCSKSVSSPYCHYQVVKGDRLLWAAWDKQRDLATE